MRVALAEPAAIPIAPATAIEKMARFICALRRYYAHTLIPATEQPLAEPLDRSKAHAKKKLPVKYAPISTIYFDCRVRTAACEKGLIVKSSDKVFITAAGRAEQQRRADR